MIPLKSDFGIKAAGKNALVWIIGLCVTAAFAQKPDQCLSEQQKGFREGYQDRSDRCEGLYKLQVSGTPLAIMGVAQALRNTEWKSMPRLDLSWHAPQNQPVRIRAFSLQPSVSYRMDSLRSPSTGAGFGWPTDILERVGLAANDVALGAWYEVGPGDSKRVFLPLAVGGQAPMSPFEILLFPGVELNDCVVTLQPEEGGDAIWRDRLLGKKRYSAAVAIRVPLPPNLKPGLYRFEAAAHMTAGGSTSTSALIRMP